MLHIKSISLSLMAAFLLSACQLFEPLPTLPPVLTLEPLAWEATTGGAEPVIPPSRTLEAGILEAKESPQASPAAATQTPTDAPSATSRPTNPPAATATRSVPTSASAAAWKDVPIIPGAAGGSEEQGSYSYTINASVTDVQAYYERIMPLAGWQPFATGEGETGNLLLMYQKDNITATIGVIDQGGNTLVLIVAE